MLDDIKAQHEAERAIRDERAAALQARHGDISRQLNDCLAQYRPVIDEFLRESGWQVDEHNSDGNESHEPHRCCYIARPGAWDLYAKFALTVCLGEKRWLFGRPLLTKVEIPTRSPDGKFRWHNVQWKGTNTGKLAASLREAYRCVEGPA